MEDNALIFKIYGNSPAIKIIDHLMSFPKNDFTQKEILDELGMSKTTFYKYFGNLLDTQMVSINRRIGNSKLYHINLESSIIQSMKQNIDQLSKRIADKQLKKTMQNVEYKVATRNMPGKMKYQIFDESDFSRGREVLGDLIVHGMMASGGTDIDWIIEHKKKFLILEFKEFHNDKITIPKGQMKLYANLHDQLNKATKCFFYVIACDDVDFSNPDSTVWLFEMSQWKAGAIPKNTLDIYGEESGLQNKFIIYREYMNQISVSRLRDLIASDLEFEEKFDLDIKEEIHQSRNKIKKEKPYPYSLFIQQEMK